MKSTLALNQNCDFKRLYYKGRSSAGVCMVLYVRPNRLLVNRLGITAGTKLGCAVLRNRARRRLKETYRILEPEIKRGFDVVIVARSAAITSRYEPLKREMVYLLTKLGVYK